MYEFDSLDFPPGFFPLDDPALAPFAWPAEPTYGETLFVPSGGTDPRNFGFTTEVHYFFVYQGDEVLTFSGDDDLWVFVDGFLCLDVGGLHPRVTDVMSFANPADAGSATQETIVTELQGTPDVRRGLRGRDLSCRAAHRRVQLQAHARRFRH